MKIQLLENQMIGEELYNRGDVYPKPDHEGEVDETAQRALVAYGKAAEIGEDGAVAPAATPSPETAAQVQGEEPNH